MITRDGVSRTTVCESAVDKHIFQKSVPVPTAQNEHHDTLDSADACWRPRGTNNTGTPHRLEDMSASGLIPPSEIADF
jgi:hypothetical protein